MQHLNFTNNVFSGEISFELRELIRLKDVSFGSNLFKGKTDVIADFSNLGKLCMIFYVFHFLHKIIPFTLKHYISILHIGYV